MWSASTPEVSSARPTGAWRRSSWRWRRLRAAREARVFARRDQPEHRLARDVCASPAPWALTRSGRLKPSRKRCSDRQRRVFQPQRRGHRRAHVRFHRSLSLPERFRPGDRGLQQRLHGLRLPGLWRATRVLRPRTACGYGRGEARPGSGGTSAEERQTDGRFRPCLPA